MSSGRFTGIGVPQQSQPQPGKGGGGGGAAFYQTMEDNGVALPQELALNFSSDFTLTDDPGNGSTDVALTPPGTSYHYSPQPGVVGPNDLLLNPQISLSIATNGNISFTINGARPCWVRAASGLIVPTAVTGGSYTLAPPSLPAATKYCVYGLETDVNGVLSFAKGADLASNPYAASGDPTGQNIANNSPATSSGKMRIFDVVMWQNGVNSVLAAAPSSTPVQGGNWLDRRPWANGAYYDLYQPNLTAFLSNNANWHVINGPGPGAPFQVRIECSGTADVRMQAYGNIEKTTASVNDEMIICASVDNQPTLGGGGYTPANAGQVWFYSTSQTTWNGGGTMYDWTWNNPPAGSHVLRLYWAAITGSWYIGNLAGSPYGAGFRVEEIVKINSGNGAI